MSGFVSRDAATGNLILAGKRFRFAGANVANDIGKVGSANGNKYGGTVVSGSYLTTHSQIDAVLSSASQMKLSVLKATWSVHGVNHALAVQPTLGVFNSDSLEPIDYALQQCASLGIRLVIPFCEEYTAKPWYVSVTGGGVNDNFYTRTVTVNAYKAHISFVLNHVNRYTGIALKDDPTVLCWQIGNEFTSPSLTDLQYQAWADDIGHHIKVVEGAQQLVQDGTYGPKGLGAVYVDIYDQHAYDRWRTPSFLTGQGQKCHAAGKAYFVGEYDWTNNTRHSAYWTLQSQLPAWQASPYIDGSTFWDLLAPLTTWGDGYTLHCPGTTSYMKTAISQITNHAIAMGGTP